MVTPPPLQAGQDRELGPRRTGWTPAGLVGPPPEWLDWTVLGGGGKDRDDVSKIRASSANMGREPYDADRGEPGGQDRGIKL